MTTEVLRQRAEIEESIRGRTICDQLRLTAEQSADQPAMSDGSQGGWQTITWAQARQQVLELAAGFAALGLAPGERVAIMMPNRAEHVLADLGAVHAGGIPVTFYATLAAEQVGFVAGDCDARIAVLDGADQLARWAPVLDQLPGLAKIIVRDAARLPARRPVPHLGRFRGAGPGPAGRARRTRSRRGSPPSARTTRSPCSTRPARPATPRASCSPTAACSTRWPWGSSPATSPPACAGSPTCRWRTSPSGCSASTSRCRPAGHVLLLPGRQAAGLGGRRGPADRVLRRAAGLGEDPGRHPGAARRGTGPGQAGRVAGRPWTSAAATWRAASSAAPPRMSWPPPSSRPTRRCWGPSARCSGWATPRSCPARPPRCRPTWPPSSPGWACRSSTSTG